MNDKVITQAEQIATMAPAGNYFALMQRTVESQAPIEYLERLMSLQERYNAEQARLAFSDALAEFQSACPPISKRNVVKDRNGRDMYRFAALEDIVEQIRPLLKANGLSFSFDTREREGGGLTVTCLLRHRGGHVERTDFSVPATKGMNTNASQDAGIQRSYGCRYALINALGIVTADPDTDAVSERDMAPITPDQAADLEALLDEHKTNRTAFLAWLKATYGVDRPLDVPARAFDHVCAEIRRAARSKAK